MFTGKSSLVKKCSNGEFSMKYISTSGTRSIIIINYCLPFLLIETSAQKCTITVDGEQYLLKLVDSSGLTFPDTCTREVIIIKTIW